MSTLFKGKTRTAARHGCENVRKLTKKYKITEKSNNRKGKNQPTCKCLGNDFEATVRQFALTCEAGVKCGCQLPTKVGNNLKQA